MTQQVLDRAGGRAVRVDCRFVGTNVVVELLGYAWHRTVVQMNRDAERMNALLAVGIWRSEPARIRRICFGKLAGGSLTEQRNR